MPKRTARAVPQNRRVWLVLIVLALAAAAVVVAGNFSYPAPFLRRPIERQARRIIGGEIHIAQIHLVPWGMLRLGGVKARFHAPKQGEAGVDVQEIALRFRLSPLFHARREIWRFLRQRSAVSKAGPGNPAPWRLQTIAAGPLARLIVDLKLRGIGINVTAGRADTIRLLNGGCDIVYDREDSAFVAQVKSEALVLNNGWRLGQPSGAVRLKRRTMIVRDGDASFMGGRVHGEGVIDLAAGRITAGTLKATHVDLALLHAKSPRPVGTLAGKADLDMILDQGPLDVGEIDGRGSLKLTGVIAHELPLQKSLIIFATMSGLSHIELDTLRTGFVLKDGIIRNDNLAATGRPMDIQARGWVNPENGTFEQRAKIVLTKEFVEKIQPLVAKSLIPEMDGRRSFKCTFGGTFDNPRISGVQKEVIQRTLNNVVNEILDFFK